MEIARAIYEGGKIVRADDESVDYYSYINLGLRCPICGEEVHLRKGDVKKPHFAHFHKTDNSQECALRLKANASSTEWQNIIKGKEQRRKIFQQHFLDIIANTNLDFYKSIRKLKSQFKNSIIEKVTNRCVIEFNKNRKEYTILLNNKTIKGNRNFSYLNRHIAMEAIDYLFLDNNRSDLLVSITCYLLLKTNNKEKLCTDICNLLLEVDWEKSIYFSKNNSVKKTKRQNRNDKRKEDDFFNKLDLINKNIYAQSNVDNLKKAEKVHCNTILFSKTYKNIFIGITGNTNSITEIDRQLSNKSYSYKYATGDIYIASLDGNYQKFIGILTKENIDCIFNQESYLKIIQEIKNRFLKVTNRQKALKKLHAKYNKRIQKKQKNILIYKNVCILSSRKIKNRLTFDPTISIEKNNVSIKNRKYELACIQEKYVLRSTKSNFFEKEIFIKGYSVEVKPYPFSGYGTSLIKGIVCFTTRLNQDVQLGELTFEDFHIYSDVKRFLIEDCKLTLKDVNTIEKECLMAWCTVYKVNLRIDEIARINQARQDAVNLANAIRKVRISNLDN